MPDQTLKGLGVGVTRSAEQAGKLNALIAAHGGQAFNIPLIEIVPLTDYRALEQQLHTLPSFDWAIFISSNAVQYGLPQVIKTLGAIPEHLQFAAIGPMTAAELKKHGIHKVLTPDNKFDSESLLALPAMQTMQQQKVAVFRGIGGRELLADTLTQRGAEVTFFESYQRTNPQTSDHTFQALWESKRLHAIVVTSSEAMRHLLGITPPDSPWLKSVTLCVNHTRIAELPLSKGLKVHIARAPGDDAMLECLMDVANRTQH
jgi:uroporphyrinogen-III synthase